VPDLPAGRARARTPRDTRIVDDRSLEYSWHHAIETVPRLLHVQGGEVVGRAIGWQRDEWEELTGVSGLRPELPAWRPGCGSPSVDPDREAELLVRFAGADQHAAAGGVEAARGVLELEGAPAPDCPVDRW
jgi:hypothetical protein